MATQPSLTTVDKVPNIPSVLLGLTQWIHTREASVLRHAMTTREKVICTSRVSLILKLILIGERGRTRGKQKSDWGRTRGQTGGSNWGGRTRGRTRWLVKFPKFHFDLLTCHPK